MVYHPLLKHLFSLSFFVRCWCLCVWIFQSFICLTKEKILSSRICVKCLYYSVVVQNQETDKQILNPLQFNFLVDTLLKWAVKLRKGVFPLTELPPGQNEHQISIHSFILRFYSDIMGLFLFPLILSAVVSDAEVTDIVNSNNQAAKITLFSLCVPRRCTV